MTDQLRRGRHETPLTSTSLRRRRRHAGVGLALGGTAYAAAALPRDSVTTRSIQGGAVTNPKIAANTIKTGRIKDGTLTGATSLTAG